MKFRGTGGVLGLLVVLGGCAGTPVDDEETRQTVAEILAAPAEDPKPLRCLSLHAYHSVDILDRRWVLFSGSGGRYWLNELRIPCIGLHRHDTLVFEPHTGQLCSLDAFYAVDDPWWRSRTSATCALGEFHAVTKAQVDLLRDALKARPRTATVQVEGDAEGG